MADISIDEIKRLRELTGVGITDAKAALVETNGDFDKALAAMRKKGLTKAEKRGEREARAGIVGTYNHDGRIGVLVEVNCETDFVAKTADDVSTEEKNKQTAEFTEKVKGEGKPENMVPQIVEGMLKKHFAERALLEQPFVKNPDQTVGQYVKEANAKLGENIVVRRFNRMAIGEVA
jgi:elongation factor Ts